MLGIYTKIMKLYYKQMASKQDMYGRVVREWVPDSLYRCKRYSDIQFLWNGWVKDNEINNCYDFCRFYAFILNLDACLEGVDGALAELGVYKGNSAYILKYFSIKYHRSLYLYDTFEGFDVQDIHGIDEIHKNGFTDTSLNYVKSKIGSANWRKGFFPDSIQEADKMEHFAFVSIDCDLHDPMLAGLDFFWPKMNKNGIIFCHDYSSGFWEGCKEAIDEFCRKNNIIPILLPDIGGTAILQKT